jgi:hypothetical protein
VKKAKLLAEAGVREEKEGMRTGLLMTARAVIGEMRMSEMVGC